MAVLEMLIEYLKDTRVLLGMALVGVTYLYIKTRTPRKYRLPPGPTPLPILGNLIALARNRKLYQYFDDLRQKYGDVYKIQIGTQDVIMLTSFESVVEAFVKKQNDFAGRPEIYTLTSLLPDDVVMGDFTVEWKLQRKIIHSAIRKLASGEQLVRLCYNSMDKIEVLLREQNGPFDPSKILSLLVYNIISSMCFGKNFELDDPFFLNVIDLINKQIEAFGNGTPADVYPILRFLPNKAYRITKEFMDVFMDLIKTTFEEHKQNFDPDKITDLTYFILETLREEEESDGQSPMALLTENHLHMMVLDVFSAGTDTSRFTLMWLVWYMAAHPDIQTKMQREIDDTVGGGRIDLSHRPQLPYTEAVLHEVMRVRPIILVGLPHKTTCDTSVGGYDVPAGTQVLMNTWSLHMDPANFEDPHAFKPDRFLDSDGSLSPKPPGFMPFSAGRRVCAGESLAKVELLLLTAILLQKFTFSAPPGETPSLAISDRQGFGAEPVPFKIVVTPRQQ